MNQTVYTIIGFTVIFVLNALDSAFVFFFKKDASPKANTLFLGFAAGGGNGCRIVLLSAVTCVRRRGQLGRMELYPRRSRFFARRGISRVAR